MVNLAIHEPLWKDLVALARRKRARPEHLVEQAVRELLLREEDEALLARSEKLAQKKAISPSQAEKLVRQHRSRKHS